MLAIVQNMASNSEPCGAPALRISNWKTDYLRQLFGGCCGELT